MIPQNANVTGKLIFGGTEVETFELELVGRFFQEKITLSDEGKYAVEVTAQLENITETKSIEFYYGETTEDVEVASEYNVFLRITSPTETETFGIDEEVPIFVMFRDTNELFVDGKVSMEIYNTENEKIHDEDLERKRQYYTSEYKFKEEGVYRLHFKGIFSDFKPVNRSVLVYVETSKEEANQLEINIITPKVGVYPEDVKLILRARIKYQGTPVKNGTVYAVINELEYEMAYDAFGEYFVKLPKLAENEYQFSIVAKSEDLTGETESFFKISKHRLDLQLVYPEGEQTIFIKRDTPLTFSFDVYDETGDVSAGAEIILRITDVDGKEIESRIYQTEEGEYTGIVYLDKRGEYTFTSTAELSGYVKDSVESTFTLDIEDVYVFGMELETLLNIVLVVAILILIAGFLKGIF